MKVKEYREVIIKELSVIRRSGDLELMWSLLQLLIALSKKSCSKVDIAKWFLIRDVLSKDYSEKSLRLCGIFLESYNKGQQHSENAVG